MLPTTDYPQTIGELIDKLGWMMIYSPELKDTSGFFPDRNIDSTFGALNAGLQNVQHALGEERYRALAVLSTRMQKHFEANNPEETRAGRQLIHEMEDLLIRRT